MVLIRNKKTKKTIMTDISKRFEDGLIARGFDPVVIKETWKYCGGDHDAHANYYQQEFNHVPEPSHEAECVCGKDIKRNCYICDESDKDTLVVGNCCIKRFMKKCGRTCSQCSAPHRNTANNLCNGCRPIYGGTQPTCAVFGCKKLSGTFSEYCYQCRQLQPNKCVGCAKPCGTYKRCFLCNKKRTAA